MATTTVLTQREYRVQSSSTTSGYQPPNSYQTGGSGGSGGSSGSGVQGALGSSNTQAQSDIQKVADSLAKTKHRVQTTFAKSEVQPESYSFSIPVKNGAKKELGKKIYNEAFLNTFTKSAQSGNQSKKELETEIVGQDKKYVNLTPEVAQEKVIIKAETINKFKRTFRSGYQAPATDSLTTSERMILMAHQEPTLIKNKGILGDDNKANGHNGWMRQKLLVASYVDAAGNNLKK